MKDITETAVRFDKVTVTYLRKPALRDCSVSIPAGKMVSVTGPNGAGKTTFLKAMLGLVDVDTGGIEIFGKPLETVRGRIAYVPQIESVDWDFPITAEEVVMMGRYPYQRLLRRPTEKDRQAVRKALETVEMTEYARRHIRQFSGGQQQRIFIARALAQEADLMVLDEPFTGIDARTEATLFDLMRSLADTGKSLIVVNHDLSLLERFDFVVFLNRNVVAAGTPEEVNTPEVIRIAYGGRMVHLDHAEKLIREGKIDVRR